ncbi:hypothetical protein BGLA2_2710009 [Burkholderia gladioli]|nr:hypothetical protein BGLA2_2710009 [Burkholderia gladioli]
MIDAHSSWIGLRASQGVAGSMPRAWHGWQTIFNQSMHASRAFMAGRLARQIPGLAWRNILMSWVSGTSVELFSGNRRFFPRSGQ